MQDDSASEVNKAINDAYDIRMLSNRNMPYEKIGFFNYGYWKGIESYVEKGIESSIEFAQINLIETLLAFFHKRDGNLLDVACGMGASARFATKYFEPEKITGINISERQVQICQVIAPYCKFQVMDATDLRFPDETFDNVLCVEAAMHFNPRQKFFEEAYRVLASGGRLAMSDVVYSPEALERLGPAFPKANYVASLDEYRDGLLRAGFHYVRVEDSTEHAVRAFSRALGRHAFSRAVGRAALDMLMRIEEHANDKATCCMAYAIKL